MKKCDFRNGMCYGCGKSEDQGKANCFFNEHPPHIIEDAPPKRKKVSRFVSNKVKELARKDAVTKDGLYKCHYCDDEIQEHEITYDHKKPVSKGGENNIGNIVVACDPCNLAKADMDYKRFVRLIYHVKKNNHPLVDK